MGNHGTKIQWTHFPGYKGETWNPVTGCSHISPGCDHCYAERISKRFGWPWGEPILHVERFEQPSRWKKPRAIFVCSMSDLFHEGSRSQWINWVWQRIYDNPQHIFLILTKRPEMMQYWTKAKASVMAWPENEIWPDNVWLGVTAENQETADERIPILLQTPCAHRFVSVEPMLEAVDLSLWLNPADGWIDPLLDWVIAGGESGPGARPMHPDWARSLRDQCQEAGVPYFHKQNGEWKFNYFDRPLESAGWYPERVGKKSSGRLLDGREWNEFPEVSNNGNS